MRTKKGIVTGDKMHSTVVVTVNRYKLHPKYKKKYLISKKFYAHDPDNSCKVGDEVTIRETRPLSKLKRWIVVKDLKATKETTTEKPST